MVREKDKIRRKRYSTHVYIHVRILRKRKNDEDTYERAKTKCLAELSTRGGEREEKGDTAVQQETGEKRIRWRKWRRETDIRKVD